MSIAADQAVADASEKPVAAIDRDLVGKMFGAGFTALGVGFPVMSTALGALRDAGIASEVAAGLRALVWLLLPALFLCAAQAMTSLAVLSGRSVRQGLALGLTYVLIGYMMLSLFVWALFALNT